MEGLSDRVDLGPTLSLLGVQNTPCGHYHNWGQPVDAITCKKTVTDKGIWHLHRYFNYLPTRAVHCESTQWVFVKIGWTAFLHNRVNNKQGGQQ